MKVTLEVKLSEILGRHRIKQADLARAAGVRPAGIHSMFHNSRARLEFAQVTAVLEGLEKLTGKRYTVGDLVATHYTDTDQQTDH